MASRILDTNVLIHANGDQSSQTSVVCKQICLTMLARIWAGHYQIVLDFSESNGSDVLREYGNKLRADGQGIGDIFLGWILNNYWDDSKFKLVILTRLADNDYAEFPNHKDLRKFDPSDRKWIALANAYYHQYGEVAPIIQSADIDKWKLFMDIFNQLGIKVDFICE